MSGIKAKVEKDIRRAGILMPVASLPSADGVGGFGKEAYAFVDMLADMGISIWQILPLNPLGYGNSPYQPFSSYAGDEIYIDLETLAEEGYLTEMRETYEKGEDFCRIDYEKARAYKTKYLKDACEHFWEKNDMQKSLLLFRKRTGYIPMRFLLP